MTLPTLANPAAEAISGYLRFTADRDTSWRTTLKPSLGLDDTMRLRIQWQVDDDGSFTAPTEFIVPSVSDARSWTRYPEGTNPLGIGFEQDPRETLLLFGVSHNQTRYARCRVVQLATDGTIEDSGSWSATVNATRDTLLDPPWGTLSIPDSNADGDLPSAAIARCWLLLYHLGGGSYDGAAAEDQLGISLTGCIDDSYWKGVRSLFDTTLAAGGSWAYRMGFLCRSAFGTNKVLKTATTSEEWYNLMGGRNNDLSSFDATGGGTSPAMLNTLQTYNHARTLASGTTKTRMLTVTTDLEELDGLGVPVVFYHSLFGAAHIRVDGDEPTDTQLLNAHGLLRPLELGHHIGLDVYFNAAPDDPDIDGTPPSQEKLVAGALQRFGRRWYGERLGKTANGDWIDELAGLELASDLASFALVVDDSAYSAAKVLGTRVDLSAYLNAAETDPADMPDSVRLIAFVHTNTCAFVAAGADNTDKCARALDVGKDIWQTWGGKVVPAILNQTQWDEMDADDLASYMEFVESIVGSPPLQPRTRDRRHIRTSRTRSLA